AVVYLPALGRRVRLVARDRSRTRPLGLEQGFVRAGEQQLRGGAVLGKDGDADTEGHLDVGAAQCLPHRSVDLLDPGGDDLSALTVGIRKQQHEFIPAEPVWFVANADRETKQVG